MKHPSAFKGVFDWQKNEEWFKYDERRQRYYLTEKATEEARRSFEKYKIMNYKSYKDMIIDYERIW